jgi:hypothetical protein
MEKPAGETMLLCRSNAILCQCGTSVRHALTGGPGCKNPEKFLAIYIEKSSFKINGCNIFMRNSHVFFNVFWGLILRFLYGMDGRSNRV